MFERNEGEYNRTVVQYIQCLLNKGRSKMDNPQSISNSHKSVIYRKITTRQIERKRGI